MIRFFLFLFFVSRICSAQEILKERTDGVARTLSFCDTTPCTVAKSIVFFPIFPWFQYPADDIPVTSQFKKFNRFSAVIDLMLAKQNYSLSGYNFNLAMYKKWVGVDVFYETMNNTDITQKTFATHFVFRFMPRRHFQPFFAIGVRHLSTYRLSESGFEISFFNYKISFSKYFNMYIMNYISWINGGHIVTGSFGFEYYVLPTISLKSIIEVRSQLHVFVHSFTAGISLLM